MVRSTELIGNIQHSLPPEDWRILGPAITELNKQQGRRARKSILSEINAIIIDTALKNNNPSLVSAIPDIQGNEMEHVFSQIIRQHIKTKNDAWLTAFLALSHKLEKKSNQSRIFAMAARDLIDAGVTDADESFIATGMIMLNRISFRKYRSEIMIDIIPLLIVWAVTIRDRKILYTCLNLIEEIGDISKRSILHAELVKALATIAILDRDRNSFISSIRSTTEIHQKIRRQQCLVYILEKGVKSHFGKEMADIPQFMSIFSDLPRDAYLEVISTLAGLVLERVREKSQVVAILDELCEKNPSVTSTIVIDLLNKAERTGDNWFLSTAMKLLRNLTAADTYPVREIVRAGISVARKSGDTQVLTSLITLISTRCNPGALARVYLQFAQIMLAAGDFSSALKIFREIAAGSEDLPQFSDTMTFLLKEGIIRDAVTQIQDDVFQLLTKEGIQTVTYRAVIEFFRDREFGDIIAHLPSIQELITLHPRRDHIVLEMITILIERGFLDTHDPDILIRLAEFIQEQQHRERAVSTIVIKIAKIGVQEKNRDFLQRAVGLTCEIDGQNTRSATLSSIIDEASILAAQQGDLDLLLRMRVWSSSLLENSLAAYAMANIVDGIIKYAIDKQSPEALEEAYTIARDISDPHLKNQLFERITECFVKIGCSFLMNPRYPAHDADLNSALRPFERGLEIISKDLTTPQISLKIAGIIDIIISFSRSSSNPDFIIPLAMYAVRIDNTFERDAMMARILSNLSDDLILPDSTDPYEVLAFLLQRNEGVKTYPGITTLISQIIQRIVNPYSKLTGLCNLLDTVMKTGDTIRSGEILKEICAALETLPAEYQKVLILSDLATVTSTTDPAFSARCIGKGLDHLKVIEFDREEIARRQIIIALVSLHAADPKDEWIDSALSIVQKISDPVAYIHSLISIYRMIRRDKVRCNDYLQTMIHAADRIPSPYEKADILLDIVPLALQDCGDSDIPQVLLKKTEALTIKINIPSIADTIRSNTAQVYFMLFEKTRDNRFRDQAIQIIRSIEDDTVRMERLSGLDNSEKYDVIPQYIKIRLLTEKITKDGIHPSQIITLERLVRSVADRGKESVIFCNLAVFFKQMGEGKVARKMIQNAVKEARIIRPLSRRSYVMCDIALKCYSAGCEHAAQEILDSAIDAATNIRQSALRDEVFDELGHAIKIMQEM